MSYAATFDTYKVIKNLTAEGMPEKQASVVVSAIREGREEDLSQLATKSDFYSLKSEMAELKAELIKWMFGGFLAVIGLSVTILMKLH